MFNKNKKKIIIWTLYITIGIFIIYKLYDFMIIDKCLDNGGKWNYETCKCEYN